MVGQLNEHGKKVDEAKLSLADFETQKRRLHNENADLLRQLQELDNSASLLSKTKASLHNELEDAKRLADSECKERVALLSKYRNLEHEKGPCSQNDRVEFP